MTAICAFCDGVGEITREHVWPDCFLTRIGRSAAHLSRQSGRAHGADYVVADVCEHCNNVLLSDLDAYFCKMYDDYFGTAHGFDTVLQFSYNYDLLARTLLKIAFNSARSAGSSNEVFLPVREYIRLGGRAPNQFALFCEIVSPTYVNGNSSTDEPKVFLPQTLYRSAITRLLSPNGDRLHTRIVAVNSFYFHLALPEIQMSDSDFQIAAAELPAFVKGVVSISPSLTQVELTTSPQNALSSLRPHVEQHREAYDNFFKRRGK